MNILYLIGNGFDLNLGIKSSYRDFYKYYQAITSPNATVKKLKESISNDYVNWSDLEIGLGNYINKIDSLTEFDELFDDLLENLGNYLEDEESKFKVENINTAEFYVNLISPEQFLSFGEQEQLKDYKNRWPGHEWYVNIVTFNYTRIIEKILDYKNTEIYLGGHNDGHKVKLRRIEHIHGYTDDRMILGVNDTSQLNNQKFHNNQDVLEAFVKSNCNKAYNHLIDQWFENQIKMANLICVYGSSIGITDSDWWKLIGERLKEDVKLILFTKGLEIPSRLGFKKNRKAREEKERFLSRTNLSEQDKNLIRDKIYIGVNSKMFGNILK